MRNRSHSIVRAAVESLEPRKLMSLNVVSQHGGADNTGQNLTETVLTPADVNATNFGKAFTTPLDGGVITAQPIYMQNVNITAGPLPGDHSVVFVGTEVDGLFAVDANTGTVLWHDSFLDTSDPTNLASTAGVSPIRSTDIAGNTDVGNNIGIVATPAVDVNAGVMYVTTNTREVRGADTHFVQRLWAVGINNGAAVMAPAVIGDTIADTGILGNFTYVAGPIVNGTGNNNPADPAHPTYPNTDRWLSAPGGQSGSVIAFNAILQMERPAVTLVNGNLFLAFASHGDDGPYYGWVLGYKASNLSLVAAFDDITSFETNVQSSQPYVAEGGLWMSGSKIANDGTNLFLVSGNGAFNGAAANIDANGFPLDHDYGDALLKLQLDPASTPTSQNGNGWGLKVADYFVPSNQYELNALDLDLGSGGVTLLPNNQLDAAGNPMLMFGGKESRIYLIDRNNLGKFNSSYPQTSTTADPRLYDHALGEYANNGVDGSGKQVYSSGTYFNGNIYYGLNGSAALEFNTANFAPGTIPPGTTFVPPVTKTTLSWSYPGEQFSLSANGTTNGILWAINRVPSDLLAYDANNFGGTQLYDSAATTGDSFANGVKFSLPLEASGMVYLGDGTGDLIGYGLRTAYVTATAGGFAAPTNLSTTEINAADARLTWTSNSTLATEFKVERSTDGTNFTTVAFVANPGTSTVTFDDTTVAVDTRYYYRVSAVSAASTTAVSSAAVYAPALVLSAPNLYIRGGDDGIHLDVWDNTTGSGQPTAAYVMSQFGSLSIAPTTTNLTLNFYRGDPLPGAAINFSPTSAGSLTVIGGDTAGDSVNVYADHMTVAEPGAAVATISYSNAAMITFDGNGYPNGDTVTQWAQPAGGVFQFGGGSSEHLVVSGGSYTFTNPGMAANGSPIYLLNSLTIGAATVAVAPSVDPTMHAVFLMTSLTMTGGATPAGQFDLADNYILMLGSTFNPALVADGYDAGRWDGRGVISSTAAADSTHATGVGVYQNLASDGTSPIVTSEDGFGAGAGYWFVNYTHAGDANLDERVDGGDYTLVDNGFNQHLTGWLNGDFNYDGKVDGSDYTLIDNSFNTQTYPVTVSITSAAQTIATNTMSAGVTVTLRDSRGNAVKAPADVVLNLSSTSGGGFFTDFQSHPISAPVISQGQSAATFYYVDANAGSPVLTVATAGYGTVSQTETIRPSTLSQIGIQPGASGAVGSAIPLVVRTQDDAGNIEYTQSTPLVLQLSTSSPTGIFSTSSTGSPVVTSVTVPANSATAGVQYFDTTPGSPVITVTSATAGTAVIQLQITGPATRVVFTTPPRLPAVNTASAPVTVSLMDAAGNLVPATSAVTLTLSSSSAGGAFLNGALAAVTTATIPVGSTGVTVEYKDTSAGTPTLTAKATGLTSGTQAQTVKTAYVLPAGTVAFYGLNNPANLYADTSGNGNNLKLNGGSVSYSAASPGGRDGSANFGGNGNLVTASGAFPTGVPTGSAAYTIAAWVDVSSVQKNGIVGWGNYGTNDQVNAFRTTQGESAPDGAGLDNYWWANDYVQATGSLLGNWAYVAVTFNGTNTRTMYVNGVSLGTMTGSGENAQATNFRVGVTNGSEFFNGNMADLLIDNTALTATQIMGLFNQG